MSYREIIPPERLQEFEKLGESKVQANLDAGLYGGRRKDHAILFLKMCESEREPSEQASNDVTRWHKTGMGQVIIGVLIVVFGWAVVTSIRFLLALR